MSSRKSDLSRNQKLTFLIASLAILATIVAAFISGHDWFQPTTSLAKPPTLTLNSINPQSTTPGWTPTPLAHSSPTMTLQITSTFSNSETPTVVKQNSSTPLPSVTPTNPVIIESDVPGTPLESDTTIVSTLDPETKPRDVFAIELIAGQTAHFAVKSNGPVALFYADPGFATFDAGDGISFSGMGTEYDASFVAAITGTYYLAAKPYGNGISYELSLKIESADVTQVQSDVPGTPLESDTTVVSTLDKETKPRDVFAIEIRAGQTAYFTVESNGGVALFYADPGFPTFESGDGISFSGLGTKYNASFVAATTGTYYLMVKPYGNGIKYELRLVIR